MSYNRGILQHVDAMNSMVVMFFVLVCLSACGTCSVNGLQKGAEYNVCGSHGGSFDLGFEDACGGDVGLEILLGNSMHQLNLENGFANSNLLCCSSTLPEYNSELTVASGVQPDTTLPQGSNQGRNKSSNCCILKSLCGRLVSCSLNFEEAIPEKMKPGILGDSYVNEKISPHLLDSGQKYFYIPSLASLKVANIGSDSILTIYKPNSSNSQLYPCNISQIIEEEVGAWISFSSENTSHWTKAFCCMNSFEGFTDLSRLSVKEGLEPVISMKPHNNWEVGAHRTETIIELDFPYHSQGKMFGGFFKSSEDKIDTVMVPLETEVGGRSTHDVTTLVSVLLEALVPCGGRRTVIAVSLRNGAPYVLSVVKISGIGEAIMPFEIKYTEGLMIFPGTVTQVAFIELHGPPPEISNINTSCKLLVLTNDSSSPLIEIPCNDVVSFCSRHHSYFEYEHANSRTWPLHRGIQSTSQVKALEMAEADELVLEHWKSQGTTKELHSKNTGDLPLEVNRVKISGSDFKLDGFVVPVKATIPMPMISSNFCEPSVLWTRVKKSSVAILFVGSTMFLVICCIQDYLFECAKSYIAVLARAGKSSPLHLNQEPSCEFAISCETNGVLRSVGEEKEAFIVEPVNTFPHVQDSVAAESSHIEEALKPENLTVKIGKEKGRRRRKRKSSNTGLQLGVSSQSSNSTPSSPLSPAASLTPKQSWPSDVGKITEARNPFAHVADRPSEKSAVTENAPKESLTMPNVSVTPCAPNVIPSPSVVSTSTIAPYARAPGSKLYDQERVEIEEKRGNDDEFRYDIWGDHLFGLHPIGSRGNKVYANYATENNSDSFFVRSPQALMTNYKLKSVSSLQAV